MLVSGRVVNSTTRMCLLISKWMKSFLRLQKRLGWNSTEFFYHSKSLENEPKKSLRSISKNGLIIMIF